MKKIEFRGELSSEAVRKRFRDMEFRIGELCIHLTGLWGKKRIGRVGKRQFSRINGEGHARHDE